MQTLLSHPDLVGIVAVTFGTLTGLVIVLAAIWGNHRRAEMDASLKHEMITRGVPAEEIERVLRAKSGPCAERERGAWAGSRR